MAHDHHHPSHDHAAAATAVAHGTADDEYLFTPPGAGYEHTDASVWIIVKFGLWLVIAAVLITIGMGLVFGLFVRQTTETQHLYPLAVEEARRLPAEPRLQSIPVNEIYQFRQQEEDVLRNYRWIDRNSGLVQIPIADAMRLTVERGLPARAQAPTGQPLETPGMMPADSSSGRTMERRRQ